jgi:hypothetical protein
MVFANPESIRTRWDIKTKKYSFYQVPQGYFKPLDKLSAAIKLNPLTYSYMGLIGDEDSPVAIPPLLSALDDVYSQLKMLKNIGYVSDQLGLMGFMEALLAKPSQAEGEGDSQYSTRLSNLLDDAKQSIGSGLKDGIMTGYKDDHEFNFHSTTKDTSGVASIFDINHKMVANGTYTPTAFIGGSSGSDTMINVVFTKMLAQLHNIQTMVAMSLKKGFKLELLLAGYQFDDIHLTFKPSTITDQLKQAQAQEIEIRNNHVLYYDGITDLDTYAVNVGYEKADQKEPRESEESKKVVSDQVDKEKKEKKDDSNDRTSRAKKKDQPARKDGKQD